MNFFLYTLGSLLISLDSHGAYNTTVHLEIMRSSGFGYFTMIEVVEFINSRRMLFWIDQEKWHTVGLCTKKGNPFGSPYLGFKVS